MTAHASLGAFLDTLGKRDEQDVKWLAETPPETLIVEAFILNLLTRWQLEDEGVPIDNPEFASIQKELSELNKILTDENRGAVISTIVAWAQNGDHWLLSYINRYETVAGSVKDFSEALGIITIKVTA